MFKISNYKIGFDMWGFILFLIIMLPNFIWFALPAVHDVLRNESTTPLVDMIASVFQVIMVASLCLVINKCCQKPMKKGVLGGMIILILLYYIGWCLYYTGMVNTAVILDLCIAPCLAFVLYSVARKNVAAFLSASVFMICHVLYGIMNFVV